MKLGDKHIVLSDISAGMVEDARNSLLQKEQVNFEFLQLDCENIPFENQTFDRVLANHVLFYCKNLGRALSEIQLYEIFGLENGERLLQEYFSNIELVRYEDELLVTDADLLCDYIFFCHGNQNEILCDRKSDFRVYVAKKVEKSGEIRITKDVGIHIFRVKWNIKKNMC